MSVEQSSPRFGALLWAGAWLSFVTHGGLFWQSAPTSDEGLAALGPLLFWTLMARRRSECCRDTPRSELGASLRSAMVCCLALVVWLRSAASRGRRIAKSCCAAAVTRRSTIHQPFLESCCVEPRLETCDWTGDEIGAPTP